MTQLYLETDANTVCDKTETNKISDELSQPLQNVGMVTSTLNSTTNSSVDMDLESIRLKTNWNNFF